MSIVTLYAFNYAPTNDTNNNNLENVDQPPAPQFSRWGEMKKYPVALFFGGFLLFVILVRIILPLLGISHANVWLVILLVVGALIVAPFRLRQLNAADEKKIAPDDAAALNEKRRVVYGQDNGLSAMIFGILGLFLFLWPLGLYPFLVGRKARREAAANDGVVDGTMQIAYALGLICVVLIAMALFGALLAGLVIALNQ